MDKNTLFWLSRIAEKKDHIINKIPSLSTEQKDEVIAHFNKFPHKESLIDWNNYEQLTWDDFVKVMDSSSKRQKTKNVKRFGIEGLDIDKDYKLLYQDDDIVAVIPYTHHASCLIASNRIGGVTGEWCTAANDPEHWDRYKRYGIKLIYIIDKGDPQTFGKAAIAVFPDEGDAVRDGHTEGYSATDDLIHIAYPADSPLHTHPTPGDEELDTEMTSILKDGVFSVLVAKARAIEMPLPDRNTLIKEWRHQGISVRENPDGSLSTTGQLTLEGWRIESLTDLGIQFADVQLLNVRIPTLKNLKGFPTKAQKIIVSTKCDFSTEGLDGEVGSLVILTTGSVSLDAEHPKLDHIFIKAKTLSTTLETLPREMADGLYLELQEHPPQAYVGAPTLLGTVDIRVSSNEIGTLRGFENSVVTRWFHVAMHLDNLENSPKEVHGVFHVSSCQLKSLEGSPRKVKHFYCSYNQLKSLQGGPTYVEERFDCSHNPLESLVGAPLTADDVRCSHTNITSLVGLPEELKRLDCNETNLVNFVGGPKVVGLLEAWMNDRLESIEGMPFVKERYNLDVQWWEQAKRLQSALGKSHQELLQEKKDHLINKIPSLTAEQKKEIIDHFAAYPHKESMVDWNNYQQLTWADFEKVIANTSRRLKKKKVKRFGIAGLEEGVDYKLLHDDEKLTAVIPCNHYASSLIALPAVGGVEGKWCTSEENNSSHWDGYVETGYAFVYIVDKQEPQQFGKLAIAVPRTGPVEAYTAEDKAIPLFESNPKFEDEAITVAGYIGKGLTRLLIEEAKAFKYPVPTVDQLIRQLTLAGATIVRRPDGKLDVKSDIVIKMNVEGDSLLDMGLDFHTVLGEFYVDVPSLKNMKGFPRKASQAYTVIYQKEFSTEGAPDDVNKFSIRAVGSSAVVFTEMPKKVKEIFVQAGSIKGNLSAFPQEVDTVLLWVKDHFEEKAPFVGAPLKMRSFSATSYYEPGRYTLEGLENSEVLQCTLHIPLTTLKGCPNVRELLSVEGCGLTSLEGAPEECDIFLCGSNLLTDLTGAPQRVAFSFKCQNNDRLTSLKGAPQHVGHSFDCSHCAVESLEGGPTNEMWSYLCSNTKLKNFVGAPSFVQEFYGGSLPLLESLEGLPSSPVPPYLDAKWRDEAINLLIARRQDQKLTEKKDHLINKLDQLSAEQKQELASHLKKYPHKESLIDRGKVSTLQWSDFEKIIAADSKRARRAKVKRFGVGALEEGRDYKLIYDDADIMAVLPLHHEASCYLSDESIGGEVGRWCISMRKDPETWDGYVEGENRFVFIFSKDPEKSNKVVVRIQEDEMSVYDSDDNCLFIAYGPANAYETYHQADGFPSFFSETLLMDIVAKVRALPKEEVLPQKLTNLFEKKDHIIKRIPSLTDEQKETLISHFDKYPHKEKMIDWNKYLGLTWNDFEPVLKDTSRRLKKKSVKKFGLAGLEEREDFHRLYEDNDIVAVVPFNHYASCLIAMPNIGGIEGEWCTASSSNHSHWYSYRRADIVLIYIIDKKASPTFKKMALAVGPTGGMEAYDAHDQTLPVFDNNPLYPKGTTTVSDYIGENVARVLIERSQYVEYPAPTADTLLKEWARSGLGVEKRADGKVNISGHVFISDKLATDSFQEMGLEFGTIEGNFTVNGPLIRNMKGFPEKAEEVRMVALRSEFSTVGAPKNVTKLLISSGKAVDVSEMPQIADLIVLDVGVLRGSLAAMPSSLAQLEVRAKTCDKEAPFAGLSSRMRRGCRLAVSDPGKKYTLQGMERAEIGGFLELALPLDNLKGCPQNVASVYVSHCRLLSLEGLPKSCDNVYCKKNMLQSLEGAPTFVSETFDCSENPLKTLRGAPQLVGHTFDCSRCGIESLEGGPQGHVPYYNCSHNQLKNFMGAPREVDTFWALHLPSLESVEGLPTPRVALYIDKEWEVAATKLLKSHELKEKKDHLINKLPNLTADQKRAVIAHFHKYPHKENLVDWNAAETLTWADFEDIMKNDSKRLKKAKVKAFGVKGLKEGEDYILIHEDDHFVAVMPLNHMASCLLASPAVGGVEGKWCVAMEKEPLVWAIYKQNGGRLIYLITKNTTDAEKIAVLIDYENVFLYDREDSEICVGESHEGGIDLSRLPPGFSELVGGYIDQALFEKMVLTALDVSYYITHDDFMDILKERNEGITERDGVIDVPGSIHIDFLPRNVKSLAELGVQFGEVSGEFSLEAPNITSLEGCPKKAWRVELTVPKVLSLQHCTQQVEDLFTFWSDRVRSLDSVPPSAKSYRLYIGELPSFEGAPEEMGDLVVKAHTIYSFRSFPKKIHESAKVICQQIFSMEGLDECEVGYGFAINDAVLPPEVRFPKRAKELTLLRCVSRSLEGMVDPLPYSLTLAKGTYNTTGIARTIKGDFTLLEADADGVRVFPESVDGEVYIVDSNLRTFKGLPRHIGKALTIRDESLDLLQSDVNDLPISVEAVRLRHYAHKEDLETESSSLEDVKKAVLDFQRMKGITESQVFVRRFFEAADLSSGKAIVKAIQRGQVPFLSAKKFMTRQGMPFNDIDLATRILDLLLGVLQRRQDNADRQRQLLLLILRKAQSIDNVYAMLDSEHLDDVLDALAAYFNNKNKREVKEDPEVAQRFADFETGPITDYTATKEFEQWANDFFAHKAVVRDADAETTILYEKGDWQVITPHTFAAAKKLACTASGKALWCTSASLDHWKSYERGGAVLIIILNKATEYLVQMNFATSAVEANFRDAKDRSMTIGETLKQIPMEVLQGIKRRDGRSVYGLIRDVVSEEKAAEPLPDSLLEGWKETTLPSRDDAWEVIKQYIKGYSGPFTNITSPTDAKTSEVLSKSGSAQPSDPFMYNRFAKLEKGSQAYVYAAYVSPSGGRVFPRKRGLMIRLDAYPHDLYYYQSEIFASKDLPLSVKALIAGIPLSELDAKKDFQPVQPLVSVEEAGNERMHRLYDTLTLGQCDMVFEASAMYKVERLWHKHNVQPEDVLMYQVVYIPSGWESAMDQLVAMYYRSGLSGALLVAHSEGSPRVLLSAPPLIQRAAFDVLEKKGVKEVSFVAEEERAQFTEGGAIYQPQGTASKWRISFVYRRAMGNKRQLILCINYDVSDLSETVIDAITAMLSRYRVLIEFEQACFADPSIRSKAKEDRASAFREYAATSRDHEAKLFTPVDGSILISINYLLKLLVPRENAPSSYQPPSLIELFGEQGTSYLIRILRFIMAFGRVDAEVQESYAHAVKAGVI